MAVPDFANLLKKKIMALAVIFPSTREREREKKERERNYPSY